LSEVFILVEYVQLSGPTKKFLFLRILVCWV